MSLGATHLAAALAGRLGASVTAVGVMGPVSAAVTAVRAASPLAADEEGRLELLAIVRSSLAGVPGTNEWEKRAMVGIPSDTINEVAGSDAHTLILLGLGHHGRVDRFFGGETTVPVIQHARVPVLAVASDVRTLPRRAVAAIDFSDASLTAAAIAGELLDDGGTLSVAHVSAFGDASARPGDLIDLYRAGVTARLDQAVQRLRRWTRRHVEGVRLHGQIAPALLEYADASASDLIALGGHEMGLAERVLLGSVRTTVVRAAKCSILIAPPAQPASER